MTLGVFFAALFTVAKIMGWALSDRRKGMQRFSGQGALLLQHGAGSSLAKAFQSFSKLFKTDKS